MWITAGTMQDAAGAMWAAASYAWAVTAFMLAIAVPKQVAQPLCG